MKLKPSNSAWQQVALLALLCETAPDTHAAPAAQTNPATLVGNTSAQLNGFVWPNGAANVVAYFQYGDTASYGQFSSAVPVSSPQPVAITINGLTPGINYHFRMYAYSVVGGTSANGADMQFTALSQAAPTVQTLPATAITSYSAQLQANVDPAGGSTSAYFDYGTTTNYTSRTSLANLGTTAQLFTNSITNLTAATTYHFRVVAYNSGGTNRGSDGTLTTLPLPAPPVLNLVRSGSLAGVSFAAETGRVYRVEASDVLVPTAWTPLITNTVTQSPVTYYDAGSGSRPRRWYRVVMLP